MPVAQQQFRCTIGCYAARLTSALWSPRSSGRASRCKIVPEKKNYQGRWIFLVKFFLIAIVMSGITSLVSQSQISTNLSMSGMVTHSISVFFSGTTGNDHLWLLATTIQEGQKLGVQGRSVKTINVPGLTEQISQLEQLLAKVTCVYMTRNLDIYDLADKEVILSIIQVSQC